MNTQTHTQPRSATARHTPGPWRVTGGPTPRGNAAGVCSVDGLHVTDVHGYGTSIETDHANARLIAAAPDLLAALENVSAKLERLCGVSYPDAIALDLSQARAAIARAKGQA